jgi:hypothetical protein
MFKIHPKIRRLEDLLSAFQLDEIAVKEGGFHASISVYPSARISAKTTAG